MSCFKNIFVVFWSFLFCYGTLYAKTIIHLTDLSVGEYRKPPTISPPPPRI
jgi:hypothetical protein